MQGIIDRFEGIYAVVELEDKRITNIEIARLPVDAKEGSVLIFKGNTIEIDKTETNKVKTEVDNIMNELYKK